MIDLLLRKHLLPDPVIRFGIRKLLAERIREESRSPEASTPAFANSLRGMPVAINTSESRQQHYEVPTAFYQAVLGPHLKYSCCHFEHGTESLGEAEEAMLRLYVQRAGLEDGQDVLELGCGWGSLSLWLAALHPKSRITGVSHSRTQKEFIDAQAAARGIRNLRIITCDMNEFAAQASAFDRVISIEMFEHMKNWPLLFSRISAWLRPGGKFFMHVFTHHKFAYHFVEKDQSDWMSRHFFTGGMMPSDDLASCFQDDLRLAKHWQVDGRHYQLTAEHWLKNMDSEARNLAPLFAETYGPGEKDKWWAYWRVFFMSCAELWGYAGGKEWQVSHYLFENRRQARS